MIKCKLLLFCSLMLFQTFTFAQEIGRFFVSSHVGDHPAGIALYSFNYQTGETKFLKEFQEINNSSYLAVSNDGNYLFTIDQPSDKNQGTLTSFYIIDQGMELEFINSHEIPGRGPCYVSQSENGNTIMVANYPQGNVVTFSLTEDGFIGDPVANIYHQGSGINKERQEAPHPHMILQIPQTSLVVVPDLGIDKIMIYQLKNDGRLTPANQPYTEVPPGSGPRHVAFHPSMKFFYVLNELNGTVTSFKMDTAKEEITPLITVSILPTDFKEFNKSADILVTNNGKYVYATNRGHNSIAILEIEESSGKAILKKTVNCGGDWPRAFRMDPTGKYLLVANKNSGNIVTFLINENSGDLKFVSESNQFPGPQCIRFLKN